MADEENRKNILNNLVRRSLGGFAYIIAEKTDRIAGLDNSTQIEHAVNPLEIDIFEASLKHGESHSNAKRKSL